MQFMDLISNNDYNLKFTMNCDQQKISFLDVEIFINEEGLVGSSLYRKSSAGNTILHATSSHPKPLLRSIPYSQYLWIKRKCSQETNFQKEAQELYSRLKNRGYGHTCFKKAYNKVEKTGKKFSNFFE